MAKKSLPFISGITNAKNRTLVIVLAVVILASLIFAISRLNSSSDDPLSKQGSVSSGVPKIQSVPGGITSEKYAELQRAENIEKAEQAIKAKTAAIPTIIGAIQETPDTMPVDLTAVDSNLPDAQDMRRTGQIQIGGNSPDSFIGSGPFQAQKEREQRRIEIEQRRTEQVERVERLRREQQERQEKQAAQRLEAQERKEYDAAVKRVKTNMTKYVEGAYKEWSTFPPQVYRAGKWENEGYKTKAERMVEEKNKSGDTFVATSFDENGVPQSVTRQPKTLAPKPSDQTFIKAGTVLFGVLDTSVNTDEKGPILATIVHGKYKGGKLIGSISHDPRQEKATLTFKTLTLPTLSQSMAVDVVAIDPDTARTALASDVDKHYLMRYGSLFASSFLEGYGKAISEQGSTSINYSDGSTTTTKPKLSGSEEFYTALGEVGKRWGQQMRPLFNRPYTVTIDAGTGVGLLFTSDANVTPEE